jgi:hypothetical protein
MSIYITAVEPETPPKNKYDEIRHVELTFFVDKPGKKKAYLHYENARVIGTKEIPDWGVHTFLKYESLQDYIFADGHLSLGVEVKVCPMCDTKKAEKTPVNAGHSLQFQSLLNNSLFSDISFTFGTTNTGDTAGPCPTLNSSVFYAHKAILCATSPYFNAMFTSDFAESREREIHVTACSPTIFGLILEFFYTGQIASLCSLEAEALIELSRTADLYGIDILLEQCHQELEEKLDADNALTMIEYAYHSSPELMDLIVEILQHRWTYIRHTPKLKSLLASGNVDIIDRLLDIAQRAQVHLL